MARPKKTAGRKPATRKTKTTRTQKAPTTKEEMSAHLKSKTAEIKLLKGNDVTKRPPNNPDIPQNIINSLNNDLNSDREVLEAFAQHLRALDRKRLNGVGIKKLGFIDRAYELSLENGEFLPHYLSLEKFGTDYQYFLDFRDLTDLCKQIQELLWNITIKSADIVYTDALEFYSSVREAAKRRVDAAETLYAALSPFFKPMGKKHEGEEAEPTKKQALRDFKAVNAGRHDGIVAVENISPKITGGKRKIIDEKFSDSAEFKETEEGAFKE